MNFLRNLFGKKQSAVEPSSEHTQSSSREAQDKAFVLDTFKLESTTPEKTQKAIKLVEKYINGEHPMDAMMQMLVPNRTKPTYKVVSNNIARQGYAHIDMKIVSVASCLRNRTVNLKDTHELAKMALEAIQHYASISIVQTFFLVPYHLRTKMVIAGSVIPPEEQCRVYSGVENLLLEIYEELPQGGTITDKIVEQKIDRLIKSL